MWSKEQIKGVLTSKAFALAAVSVGSFAAGAGGSYIFFSKKLEKHYRLVADEEVLAAKIFYSKRAKVDEFSDPTALVEDLGLSPEPVEEEDEDDALEPSQANMLKGAIEILDQQKYTNYSKAEHIPEPPSPREVEEVKQSVRNNIFDQARAEYVQADELAKMAEGKPYIITVADYMSGKSGFAQMTLNYYMEDDVLANEIDIPVEDQEATIGEDNIRFGCGSSDPSVVYVRNDEKYEEYEIIRHTGSFAEEVADMYDPQPKVKRFRPDREN